MRTCLHGDAFATVGTRQGVTWFKDALEKRFEIKSECISPVAAGVGEQKGAGATEGPATTATNGEAMKEGSECRLLNRVVRCTTGGWEVERGVCAKSTWLSGWFLRRGTRRLEIVPWEDLPDRGSRGRKSYSRITCA